MNQPTARPFPVVDIDAHPPLSTLPVDHIGDMDNSLFFDRLSHAGIDIACGRLLPPPGFFDAHAPEEAIALLNCGALNLARANSRYLPALWIHPACPEYSIAQIQEYSAAGVRMIGLDARFLEAPALLPILSCAQSLNMTLSLHGENLAQIDALAARFPDLRILIGGLGSSGYMPAPAFNLMKAHDHLMINLSGSIWGGNYVLHEWCSRLGAHRLLFGSGYPFSNPAGKLAALRWELRDQPDSVHEQIFSKNALLLTGAKGGIG